MPLELALEFSRGVITPLRTHFSLFIKEGVLKEGKAPDLLA